MLTYQAVVCNLLQLNVDSGFSCFLASFILRAHCAVLTLVVMYEPIYYWVYLLSLFEVDLT